MCQFQAYYPFSMMFISVTNDASKQQISFTEHAYEPSTVTVILDIMCINSIK